jgi:hypothetical protein
MELTGIKSKLLEDITMPIVVDLLVVIKAALKCTIRHHFQVHTCKTEG